LTLEFREFLEFQDEKKSSSSIRVSGVAKVSEYTVPNLLHSQVLRPSLETGPKTRTGIGFSGHRRLPALGSLIGQETKDIEMVRQ
jgi:hypothetical protein